MYRDSISKILWASSIAFMLLMGLYWSLYHGQQGGPSNPPQLPATISSSSDPSQPFEEGKHYQRLSAKITTNRVVQQFRARNPNKIQVVEFFNYGCFWCGRLQPLTNKWLKTAKPGNVAFYRIPVIFNKGWELLAKTYLVIFDLGLSDKLDAEFFKAIHQDGMNLFDEKTLAQFLESKGVSQAKFHEKMNSFALNQNFNYNKEISEAFEISLSPSLVVNTKHDSYLVTATMVGSEKGVLDVVDFLIARDSKALAKQ